MGQIIMLLSGDEADQQEVRLYIHLMLYTSLNKLLDGRAYYS